MAATRAMGSTGLWRRTMIPSAKWTRAASISGVALCAWPSTRSEEHTSELQSLAYLVCRHLLEKKKTGNALIPIAPLFFFRDPPSTEIYTLSLHDALPILEMYASALNGGDARYGFYGALETDDDTLSEVDSGGLDIRSGAVRMAFDKIGRAHV